MEQFVTDFANRYTATIESILSKHDSQIGTHIVLQRLFKCKTRLSKACCPPKEDCESQELLVWYEVDDDKTLIRKGGNVLEEEKPPDPPVKDDTFLNEVLTHLYHMQVLIDKTLSQNRYRRSLKDNNNNNDEDADSTADYDEMLTERTILDDSFV